MNRAHGTDSITVGAVPRTRGDEPPETERGTPRNPRSPHTRG